MRSEEVTHSMALVVNSVSHSFLQTAQRCDKRLEYRYIRKIAKRVKALKPERGTWIHELLAAYYRALQKGEDGIAAARRRHEEYRAEFWDELFEEEQE